jgi:hypothetical protein
VVVSAKKEALQALCIPKNLVGNALTLHFEKIGEPVNCLNDTPVNQMIRPYQLGVALRNRPESFELLDRIFQLVRSEAPPGNPPSIPWPQQLTYPFPERAYSSVLLLATTV